MPRCDGNSEDHCCYLGKHGVCNFLEENTVPGRRWACGIYRHYGSWSKVHNSNIYLEFIRPKLNEMDIEQNCGDWPPSGTACGTCGVCD